jgi:hypothetical protein
VSGLPPGPHLLTRLEQQQGSAAERHPMTRERITERIQHTSYERVDDDRDPHPSFPPMRVVPTTGETVAETTLPLPLIKCRAASRARKVG